MKTIPLTQGMWATVDDEDYNLLAAHRWHALKDVCKNRVVWYAVRNGPRGHSKRQLLRMHREILSITNPKTPVDHANGNGLDNRRENLRKATSPQNNQNRHKAPGHSSRFKGVAWHKSADKWQAYIQIDRRLKSLGRFSDEETAAKAYDAAAREAFGEFALTNFGA